MSSALIAGKYARFELERRYLLREIPTQFESAADTYLVDDKYFPTTRLRLRLVQSVETGERQFKITQKYHKNDTPDGVAVLTNTYLTENEYNHFNSLPGMRVTKTRRILDYEGNIFCLDTYELPGETLFICEVNFSSFKDMETFVFPFSLEYEITTNCKYSGASLATLGNLEDEKDEPLVTKNLLLRFLHTTAADLVSDYYKRNKEFHQDTAPSLRQSKFYEVDHWEEEISHHLFELHTDQNCCFAITRRGHARVIGQINFTQFVRGPFHCCSLGLSMDQDEVRQGFMFEALQEAIHYIFLVKKLHRIQANCLLDNEPSQQLLRKLGFVEEGVAKNYLHINGQWRDHKLFSLTNSNWST